MQKQFRIGNSNTFLVSKNNNNDDDSKITFALEYHDKVSNEKKLKICGHYHDKSKILNRKTINSGNSISCPDCKKNNTSLIGIPIDEKDFEILYLYGRDYYHKKDNKEKYNELYSKMYDLLVSSDNIKRTEDYISIIETFDKVRKDDEDEEEEEEEETFTLFLVKKKIIYGFYTSSVSFDSLESSDGFLYIPENFQDVEGYCKMVIKNALDIQKNKIDIKKMDIGNIKSWRDVFCNFHGAIENGLKIFFDKSEQFPEDIDLPTLEQIEKDFLEFKKILRTGNLDGERYKFLKEHIIIMLENYFYKSEESIEDLTSTLDNLGHESNMYVSIFDDMIPRNFYFSNE